MQCLSTLMPAVVRSGPARALALAAGTTMHILLAVQDGGKEVRGGYTRRADKSWEAPYMLQVRQRPSSSWPALQAPSASL